jgi:hypothetical protein
MGPRVGLVVVAKRKINLSARNQTLVIYSISGYFTDPGTPSMKFVKYLKSAFISVCGSY